MQLDDRITIATPEGVAIEVVLAGLGSRFLARLLDSVIQVLAIIALALAIGAADGSGFVLAGALVLIFLVVFAYDVAFEVLNHGRTPGKVAAGIRVVGDSGEPVRFLASAIRNIVRIVDFLPAFYLVGSISIVATGHDQRLGDLAAGTVVARDRFPGLAQPAAPITVTPDLVATWDVSRDPSRGGARGAAVPRPPALAPLAGPFVLRGRSRGPAGAARGRRAAEFASRVRARGHRRRQAAPRVAMRFRPPASRRAYREPGGRGNARGACPS